MTATFQERLLFKSFYTHTCIVFFFFRLCGPSSEHLFGASHIIFKLWILKYNLKAYLVGISSAGPLNQNNWAIQAKIIKMYQSVWCSQNPTQPIVDLQTYLRWNNGFLLYYSHICSITDLILKTSWRALFLLYAKEISRGLVNAI